MITSSSILALTAVVQVIFAQQPVFESGPPEPWGPPNKVSPPTQFAPRIPRNCWLPPRQVNLYKCCPIPTLYPDELMQRCGYQKLTDGAKPPKPLENIDTTCKKGYCVMGNVDLLFANNSVDYVKFRSYLDNWAESNPEFANAIQIAKEDCAQDSGPKGPPMCEPDRIFYCLTTNIFWNCNLRDGEGCQALQEHMDECRQYYINKQKPEDVETR